MLRNRFTFFIVLFLISNSIIAQIRCSTMQADSALRIAHPSLGNLESLEKFIKEELEHPNPKRIIGDVYTIPVVIHIIHNGDAIGTNANITDAQAISQITVLNEDFRRIFGTAGYNTHPDGADTKIEFCLAQRKPDGTATNGIDRVDRNVAGFTAPPFSNTGYIDNTIKPATTWDASRYFNLWSLDLGASLLGYAQFPSASGLNGFDCDEGLASSDGVVCHYRAFGRGTPNLYAAYNLGKTATHEVGHWLGLRHIWGDATCGDDFCADTPTHQTSNSGCPSHPKANTCGTADEMFENYMDYSGDGCLNIFTNDQKTRMRTVLTSSPLRLSLINSDACIPLAVNDAAIVDIVNINQDLCVGSFSPIVKIKNFGSANLTSATINYSLDNGTLLTQSFAGNLATLATSNVTLPSLTLSLGNHSLKVYQTLPNGLADANPALDTIIINFNVSNGNTIPFFEGFESNKFPPTDWYVNNTSNDCFTFREQTGIIGPQGTSTTTAFLYHFLYTPGASETDELTTSLIDLTNIITPIDLEFDLAYARKSVTQYEDLKIEISTDCGVSYSTVIYNKNGNTTGVNDLRTVASDQGSYWKPAAANNWRHETIDLSSFIGNKIRLKFTTTNRGGNNLFIDNIKLDNNPKVSFVSNSALFTESSLTGTIGCQGYVDVTLPISISASPTANVVVGATVTAGTATISDANIIGNVTFVSGGATTQNLTLRIFDDEATETTESFIVTLNILSGPGQILSANSTMSVSIDDNDNYPFLGTATILFSENFESTANGAIPTNWSITTPTGGGGNNNWQVGVNGGMSGSKACYITNDAVSQNLNYDIASTSRRRLISPAISTSGISNLILSFEYKCNGEKFGSTYYDFGRLMYATNPAGPYTDISGLSDASNTTTNASLVNFFNVSTKTSYQVQLPAACENQTSLYLVWRWDNDGSDGSQPPFTIDNIVLKYFGSTIPVETALNATSTKYLPGNSTIYFVSNNNKLLAKIKNNSSFDYGCTTVTLSRAGTSSKEYWNSGSANYLADKTLLISPTNNIATGSLDITLYYTSAEVTGWQSSTAKTFTSTAKIYKSNGDIANITASNPLANGTTNTQIGTSTIHATYGTDRQVTANFTTGLKTTGSAGFGVGDCLNRIITGSVASTLCSSNSNAIPFVALGLFNTGNIFTAQMSDNTGSFAVPISLAPTITTASNGYYSNTINATNIPVATNGTAYKFRVIASNPTTSIINDNGANITVQPRGLWLGLSNNYNTASNWCGGVPTTTTSAILQTGVSFQPVLTANSACSNLTIPSGTNLTLSDYILSVYGNFSGTGVITGGTSSGLSILQAGNAGTFYMNGTSATSKSLNTLTLNRTGAPVGVTLGDTLNLLGNLAIANGTLTTNNFLKLISNAPSTASISAISGTGLISGNVISQKYAPGGKTGWAMMSNAVIGDVISNWQDDFPTSGFAGSTGSAGSFISVMGYNEPTNGASVNGYVPPTNASNTVVNGKGYFVYLGDGYTNTNAIKIDATGTVRQGNYNLPVTYTASTPTAMTNDDGWNLVANPYCSNIDWNSASFTKTNIDNAIYIYNADGPYYSSYVAGVGTNGGSNIISQNQGFWVKANAINPTLAVSENVKTNSSTPFLRSNLSQLSAPQDSIARIKIIKTSNNFQDETVIRLIDGATTNFDGSFDALKLMSLNANAVNIYSTLNNVNFAINSFSASEIPIEIPIPIKVAQIGAYDLQFNIPTAISGYMYWKDNYLATQIPVSGITTLNYLFTDTVTPITRFVLGISNNIITKSEQFSTKSIFKIIPNPASNFVNLYFDNELRNAHVIVSDALGNEVLYNENIKNGHKISLENFSKGIYYLKLSSDNFSSVMKLIVE